MKTTIIIDLEVYNNVLLLRLYRSKYELTHKETSVKKQRAAAAAKAAAYTYL